MILAFVPVGFFISLEFYRLLLERVAHYQTSKKLAGPPFLELSYFHAHVGDTMVSLVVYTRQPADY